MEDQNLANALAQLLTHAMESEQAHDALEPEAAEAVEEVRRIRTYEEAGMLTRDAGIVVYLHDGTEYQVTVMRRR